MKNRSRNLWHRPSESPVGQAYTPRIRNVRFAIGSSCSMSSYIRRERHGHLPNPSNLTAHALAAGFVRSSPSFFQGRGKRKLVTTPTPSRARVWNEYFCGSLPRLRSSMRRQEFFRLSLRTAINMLTFLCLFCIPDDKLVLFALLILPLSFYLFFCFVF